MSLSLRRATTQDIPAIKRILNNAVSHKLLRGDSSWGFVQYEGEPIETSIENNTAYIAVNDDEIVGTLVLAGSDNIWGVQPPVAAYLQRFAVDYHFHRQNIGATLLNLATQEASSYGRNILRLTCPSGNTKLCAYYERLGFTRVDAKANPPAQLKPTAFFERPIQK